jgi:chromate transport protein ChrA
MSDEVYGELFALGQFMPGPTSTQVSFAVGIVKKGVKGESPAAAAAAAVELEVRMECVCCDGNV